MVVSLYHLLELFLSENESSRHCLAEPRQPRKKNTLSTFKRNFTPAKSEMQGVFFFRGSALQVFRQCGGAKYGLGFAKTIFWGKGFGKTSADFVFAFVRAEEGSGEESARALAFFFEKIWRLLIKFQLWPFF